MTRSVEEYLGEIWAGWMHLFHPEHDPEDPGVRNGHLNGNDLDPNDIRLLEDIHKIAPELFPPDAKGLVLDEEVLQQLLSIVGDWVDPDRRFTILRRFLEIIDAGNRLGKFRIAIPHIPAPLPPSPSSPFQSKRFQDMLSLNSMTRLYVESLEEPAVDLSPEEWWGRLLLSAILYGGLLKSQWLLSLPASLKTHDHKIRWIDLSLENSGGLKCPVYRRWFPDPMTRLLLVEGFRRGIPDMPKLNRKKSVQIMRFIMVYAKKMGFERSLPKTFQALINAAGTRVHLYLPPFLAQYTSGNYESTSLPKKCWNRLINPPANVASETHRSQIRAIVYRRDFRTNDYEEAWPSQLRELATQIRKGDKDAKRRLIAWQSAKGGELLPSVIRLTEWVTKRLLSKGRSRRVLRTRTVYAMLNSIGGRLVGQLGRNDPAELACTEAYLEMYQTAMEDTSTLAVRRRVAGCLRSFHDYLSETHGAPSLEGTGIFSVSGKSCGNVDANIIGLDTFFRSMQWLRHTARKKFGDEVAQALCRIAGLGFFAGLRRSEAIGLNICDIEGNHHVDLLVRPNGLRKLKTRSAQRVIPLSILMPPEELKGLINWRNSRHQSYERNGHKDGSLFYIDSLGRTLRDTDPLLELITEALQRATHDPGFRFHHLRHSFANWQLMKFWIYDQDEGERALPDWLLPTEHDKKRWLIAKKERQEILGRSPTSRRSLMQISRLLGHSSVDITLTHYLHLQDLLSWRGLRRMAPKLNTRSLSSITGYAPAYIRRLCACGGSIADELDLISDKLIANGKHKREVLPDLTSVTITDAPIIQKPESLIGRIERLISILQELISEPGKSSDIARKHETSIDEINYYIALAGKLPEGMFRQSGRASTGYNNVGIDFPDFPSGPAQMEMARRTAGVLERLTTKGDAAGRQVRTVRKKLRETVDLFIRRWCDGTPLNIRTHSLPEARKWVWLLTELGLKKGIFVKHRASLSKEARPSIEQKCYWENALGVLVEPDRDVARKENLHSRGEVCIQVRLRRIPDNILVYRKDSVLSGIRLVLVGWWMISASEKATTM